MQILTWNLRYQNRGDDARGCGWSARRERAYATIEKLAPDILAVQEMIAPQMDDLRAALPDFDAVGVGRDDGKDEGEFCGLFFRRERFELRAQTTRWLSSTPAVPSIGWDAHLKRVVTSARLFDLESGREIEIWNTHFDYEGALARFESARFLRRELEKLSVPAVLCGDFNAVPDSAPIAELTGGTLRDARTHSSQAPSGGIATFGGFETSSGEGERIDYVFTNAYWDVQRYAVPDPIFADWPPASDHWPVLVNLELYPEITDCSGDTSSQVKSF